jgi:hypothetical protein
VQRVIDEQEGKAGVVFVLQSKADFCLFALLLHKLGRGVYDGVQTGGTGLQSE